MPVVEPILQQRGERHDGELTKRSAAVATPSASRAARSARSTRAPCCSRGGGVTDWSSTSPVRAQLLRVSSCDPWSRRDQPRDSAARRRRGNALAVLRAGGFIRGSAKGWVCRRAGSVRSTCRYGAARRHKARGQFVNPAISRAARPRRHAERGLRPLFDAKPGRVTGSSAGARRDQGRPMGWRLKAPGPEEPAAWRSYPPAGGPALPGSVGSPCLRSSATADVPPVHGGALRPARAGAPAASPMSAREPSPEPSEAAARLRDMPPLGPSLADWTTARRGRGPRGPPHSGQARPHLGRYAVPRRVWQTRARQRSQRRSRDASWLW